jgi:hypothetical protein
MRAACRISWPVLGSGPAGRSPGAKLLRVQPAGCVPSTRGAPGLRLLTHPAGRQTAAPSLTIPGAGRCRGVGTYRRFPLHRRGSTARWACRPVWYRPQHEPGCNKAEAPAANGLGGNMAVRCSPRGQGEPAAPQTTPVDGPRAPPWASEMGPHHSVHSLARRGGQVRVTRGRGRVGSRPWPRNRGRPRPRPRTSACQRCSRAWPRYPPAASLGHPRRGGRFRGELDETVERPARRTGATRRGPRLPGSIVRGTRTGPPGRHWEPAASRPGLLL